MAKAPPLEGRLHDSTGSMWTRPVLPVSRAPRSSGEPTEASRRRAHDVAVGRAVRKTREYVFDYLLFWMATFTYSLAPSEFSMVTKDFARAWRRLRAQGVPPQRLAVPELGKSDNRLHIHLATPEAIPAEMLQEAWSLGTITPGNAEHAFSPQALSVVAGYLSESFHATPARAHRYYPSQGMQPKVTRFRVHSVDEALERCARQLGAPILWATEDIPGHGAAQFAVPAPRLRLAR